MIKTGEEVSIDVYRLLKGSGLKTSIPITGDIYYDGQRPRDSRLEDITIIFTSGMQIGDFQQGVVTLNLSIPDIDPYQNGVFIKDNRRCREIERYAQNWVDSLTANRGAYRWSLQQTIHTDADKERQEHFIVVRLSYQYYDGE